MEGKYLTLAEAAQHSPGRVSSSAVWRWCRRGVLARNGQRVRLEHVRFGGRLLTTHKWLDEYGHALAAADAQFFDKDGAAALDAEPTGSDSDTRRSQELERVERELDEAGL